MRIYSKFKDYYDGVSTDPEGVVWERHTKEIIIDSNKNLLYNVFDELPKPRFTNKYQSSVSYRDDPSVTGVLGFCGKVYPLFMLNTITSVSDLKVKSVKKPFTSVDRFIEEHTKINKDKNVIDTRTCSIFGGSSFNQAAVDSWQRKYNIPQLEHLFVANKTPTFLLLAEYYHKVKFVVNPVLKDYGIQSIIEPWTAYQEIDMYLSNNLATGIEIMPQFSNELKRDAHGFNNWSFKQVGPKQRKRK